MKTYSMEEEIKQKLELGFNPKYAGATNDLLDLISQALQKRDEEWQELIPILKKQGAWDKTNEQILENLEKIGKKDFAKLLTLTN